MLIDSRFHYATPILHSRFRQIAILKIEPSCFIVAMGFIYDAFAPGYESRILLAAAGTSRFPPILRF